MPGHHIRVLDEAARDLARLDKSIGRRIVDRTRWLGAHLDEIKREPLAGDFSGLYKLRVGDYRVLYEVVWHQEAIIIVHAIGHRREIYRKR